MSDKTKTTSISLPESLESELKDLCFKLDVSRSHLISTALILTIPMLKAHPLLLKYSEFEQVKQYFSNSSEPEKE